MLWAITSGPKANVARAIAELTTSRARNRPPDADPNKWDISEYAAGGVALNIISDETWKATDLARGFRNLIHPGRAARLNQVCDREASHTALGALDHVVRDLS